MANLSFSIKHSLIMGKHNDVEIHFLKVYLDSVGDRCKLQNIGTGLLGTLMVQGLPNTLRNTKIAAAATIICCQQRFYLSEDKWSQYKQVRVGETLNFLCVSE